MSLDRTPRSIASRPLPIPKVLGQKVRLFCLSELRVNLDAIFMLATAIVHDMLSWVKYIVSNSTRKLKHLKVYYQGLQTKPVSLREVLMAHILLRSFSLAFNFFSRAYLVKSALLLLVTHSKRYLRYGGVSSLSKQPSFTASVPVRDRSSKSTSLTRLDRSAIIGKRYVRMKKRLRPELGVAGCLCCS